jgi:hypothetical protein
MLSQVDMKNISYDKHLFLHNSSKASAKSYFLTSKTTKACTFSAGFHCHILKIVSDFKQ